MNFVPLKDMILVKPDQVADRIGSIFVPQGSIQGPDQPGDPRDTAFGTVVAIGPGDRLFEKVVQDSGKSMRTVRTLINRDGSPAPMLTKVGDRVVFPRRPASPGGEFSVTIEGETYMMFNEEQNCLAVIEE